MKNRILITGVGGQGLVLTNKILSQAAFNEGYDVKTNDVIGLSQRGGKVWGSTCYAKKVYSPNLIPGQVDFIIALEPLEGLRWSHMLKDDGIFIINTHKIYPTIVQQEKEAYPLDDIKLLHKKYKVFELDVNSEAKKTGNIKVANVIILGYLSQYLDFCENSWLDSIKENLKPSLVALNIKTFNVCQNLLK